MSEVNKKLKLQNTKLQEKLDALEGRRRFDPAKAFMATKENNTSTLVARDESTTVRRDTSVPYHHDTSAVAPHRGTASLAPLREGMRSV